MRNKWLKDRLKEIGKTQTGLAEVLGKPPSRVTEIIRGDRRVASDEVAVIAQFLEWPSTRVLGLLSDPKALALNVGEDTVSLTRVAVIGAVEAGHFREALEYVPDEDQPFVDVPSDARYPACRRFALQVRGPSMNLVYPEGSYIIVVPTMDLGEGWQPRPGQRVIVQRSNDVGQVEATVKEFAIDADGKAWLWPRSSDPAFRDPWRVPDAWDGNGDFDEHNENLRITGLVVQSLRNEP